MAWPNVYDLDSNRFDQEAAKQAGKPIIVLIHDAFHTPSHFEPLVRELQGAGYRTSAPQLPSCGSTCQSNAFEADVQTIYDHCKLEMDRGKNAILVLHGYAGLPGSVAGDRLNRYALSRPRVGFVVRNIFVAAVIAKEGECLLDVVRPEWLVHEVSTWFDLLVATLVADFGRTESWEFGNQIKYSSKIAQGIKYATQSRSSAHKLPNLFEPEYRISVGRFHPYTWCVNWIKRYLQACNVRCPASYTRIIDTRLSAASRPATHHTSRG